MSCIAFSGERSNIFRNRSFTLFKKDRDFREMFDSMAVSESISISMTNLSYTGLPVLVFDISPDFHTWENHLSQCSILSSLMSWRPTRVSPYLFAAHLSSSEVRSDIQIWFSPGFPMQSRQARSDPSHNIGIPNSSSALILLWLFLHLHLLVFFSTSLQDYWWNWNGWCWTNTTNDSIHHVWNFPLSACLRVGFWCQCIWFGFRRSNLILSNNQSSATLWVLETCLIVGLLPWMIILITASLSSNTNNKASWRKELTFEEKNQHCLDHQSFHEFSFALEIKMRLTVLDHSDAFSREELRRSDAINQVRVYHPSLIQRPKRWFRILLNCVKLKFVSSTSNLLEQTYDFQKCTMFHLM